MRSSSFIKMLTFSVLVLCPFQYGGSVTTAKHTISLSMLFSQGITNKITSAGAFAGNHIEFCKANDCKRLPGGGGGGRGIGIWVIDGTTGQEIVPPTVYDTWADRLVCKSDAAKEEDKDKKTQLANLLTRLPAGAVILLGVGDEAGLTWWPPSRSTPIATPCNDRLLQTLQGLGAEKFNQISYWDSYCLILVKGEGRPRAEILQSAEEKPAQSASASVVLPFGGSYTLTASPKTVSVGEPITGQWSASDDRLVTDFISLHAIGADDQAYLERKNTEGAQSGTISFKAPSEGVYELRYISRGTKRANSSPVTVVAPGKVYCYSLTASPSVISPGGQVVVKWDVATARQSDWIGLVPKGSTAYKTYFYVQSLTSGSRTITVPANLPPGTYELVYMLANGYGDAARSNQVVVQ